MSWTEIAGFVFGIAGVYLTLKENPWCFPIGLVNVIISSFLFYDQKLYADVLQQVVYIILLTYGWFKWLHGGIDTGRLMITESSGRLLLECLVIWCGGTLVLGTVLTKWTDASTPWPDSAATVLSFIAQWMVAKKKLENWLLWIAVNVTYIWIYSYKELYLYSVLFSVYLLLAVAGYLRWNREIKNYDNSAHRA